MRRVIDRLVVGALLGTVVLTCSGCFLKQVLGAIVVESLSEELTQVTANVFGNTTAAICLQDDFFTTGSVECDYIFSDGSGEGLASVTSTTQLISDFGLFGVIIDPLVLQVPSGVTNVAGTVDNPADATPPAPLVITTATSFFAQPGVEIFPEPGHVFVIIDFPASIAGLLTTTGTNLTFQFSFQLLASPGQFSGGLPIKAMFTAKVQAGGQTFYPPMLPCTTSFAGIPSITLPNGNPANLLPQIVAALGSQNRGCTNAVYNFNSLSSAAPPDHFQCFEARDRRGSLCSAGSSANKGRACAREADCGGVEDQTAFCIPRGFPKGLRVSLSDQFESGQFDVKSPAALCNPADKNDEGINDPLTHLRSYKIEPVPGQTPHARRTGIRIQNQFHPAQGDLLVDTIKPDRLLVPTATSLTQPAAPPDFSSHDVDHFKCYKVARSRGTSPFQQIRDVTILDQFNQPGLVTVIEPTRLCTPVDKNGEGIKHDAVHLMCYKVVPVKRGTRFDVFGLFLNNQFGPEIVDSGKEAEFCVPSTKLLP